jgi:hypothetical protein
MHQSGPSSIFRERTHFIKRLITSFAARRRDTVLLGFALSVTRGSMSYMVEYRVNCTRVKGAGGSHWGKSNHELRLSRSTTPDGSNL